MPPAMSSATIMPANSPERTSVISVFRPDLRFSRMSFSASALAFGFSRR